MIHTVSQNTLIQFFGIKGSAHFTTIQAAVNQAVSGDIILIHPGIYEEKLHIITPGLTLKGESSETCTIRYGDYAEKIHEDGRTYGTFRSYTCLVLADDVVLENLTIENTAGDGRKVGQAIALFVEGDCFQCRDCQLIGHQDTLFAGPLPPVPKIPGSFIGPTENHPYRKSRQYYINCLIIGDVDYIFGSALTLFNRCQLMTRNRHEQVNGYVTAPSTWESEPYGFIFMACDFFGEKDIEAGSVYFGRPWRPYGQVSLVQCTYDASIHRDHWDPWGCESNKGTARFTEYACMNTSGEDMIASPIDEQTAFIYKTVAMPDMSILDQWHLGILMMDHIDINDIKEDTGDKNEV